MTRRNDPDTFRYRQNETKPMGPLAMDRRVNPNPVTDPQAAENERIQAANHVYRWATKRRLGKKMRLDLYDALGLREPRDGR